MNDKERRFFGLTVRADWINKRTSTSGPECCKIFRIFFSSGVGKSIKLTDMTLLRIPLLSGLLLVLLMLSCSPQPGRQGHPAGWPPVSRESKPWTRWWWHGNAVTREGITSEMEAFQRAGIGGLEITPIYGVYGEEEAFIDFLSPEWMELLEHVLGEAERLDMGIDMATGTGWPFGGPWVSSADACKNLQYRIYELSEGSTLNQKVEFVQAPYLRLVGNNIYKPTSRPGDIARLFNTSEITIEDISDPINQNKNLQQLAIDQVQFEKPLKLMCLMGYSDNNQIIDLTSRVDSTGMLRWAAPQGDWKLFAVFEGFHGKMVERAGPGGEGNVIDHFSDSALQNYLKPFDIAFKGRDIKSLRAFFNDSYEVDDARGAADFTPALFEEFRQRRGYDLRNELPALFGMDSEERNHRVLCDYRETLSDLLLEKFTERWKEWAHQKGALVRNQAHGSPSNILDLYAVVDIPEIEGVEPLRFKMASSSGNVTGKQLVSAEAATWLNEHFESSLGDIREALDNFMLHGVNHLVYHGTCYSPPDESWPGRLFYAAVHANPRNPQWRDFAALNTYVSRCQSFLQNSSPDNDVLLYYPIYDRFSAPGPEMVEHFDGIGGFTGSGFERIAEEMLEKGFAFDYVSDRQLNETIFEEGGLKTTGNRRYKVIVVPECDYMPLPTLEKLYSLAERGATIIFDGKTPRSPSGFHNLESKTRQFDAIATKLRKVSDVSRDLESSLNDAGVRRERMFDLGIRSLRKENSDGSAMYFLKNVSAKGYEGWLPLSVEMSDVWIYEPMTGKNGKARLRTRGEGTEVFVQMERSQTVILTSRGGHADVEFPYRENAGEPLSLTGKWRVAFESGGPTLPAAFEMDSLVYWTDLRDASYHNFSGTATYVLSFGRPELKAARWLLQLDSVRSSAEIILNGVSIGTVIGPVFQAEFDSGLMKDHNLLELRVSNLMANRIAYMDRNNIFWKKFYNINFSARRRENVKNNIFDASAWKPRPSGVSGEARLYPLKNQVGRR